ncbi:MAG: serine/threonine protein kinase [Myxococcota bacterium]|jgi:serine/threonine protein kinase
MSEMRLDEIKQAVAPGLADQLDGLHREFSTVHGGESVESFVAWLRDRSLIDQRTFRELHAERAVLLTSMSTLYFPEDITGDLVSEPTDSEGGTSSNPAPYALHEKLDPFTQRYQLTGKLAEGAMGEIHIARDNELMRKVAVKQMHARIRDNASLAARFWREAQITAQLEHPAIVPVYNLEKLADGTIAYTMKLIQGRTFAELIEEARQRVDRQEPLGDEHSVETRLEHFVRVCEAMAYAHARGVLHRDLKPANIMVGAFGEVYVMDWGIAKRLDDVEDDDATARVELRQTIASSQTRLGAVIGTPAFMSPEQAAGETSGLDARSDQFSLGLILFELVSLRSALPDDDTMRLLSRVQECELEPLTPYDARGTIPPVLAAIVARATAAEREDRFEDVGALAEDLRRFLRGEPTETLPDRGMQRVYRLIQRHERAAGVILLLLVLLVSVLLVGGMGWNLYREQAAVERADRMAELLTMVGHQAHEVDGNLLRYQGLLTVLASNAIEATSRLGEDIGPVGYSYFLHDPFSPFDLEMSDRYGRKVSLGYPVTLTAPDVELDPLKDGSEPDAMLSVRRLALLKQPLRRILLQSNSEDSVGMAPDAEARLLLDEGTPVAFAHVALEDGVMVKYPGHGAFPNGWDPRRQAWYQVVVEGPRGPMWGIPHVDLGDLGLMLPCSMGLYDDDGIFVGVASIELTFDYVIEDLLEVDSLRGEAEVYVLDEEGFVVVSSSSKGQTFRDTDKGKPLKRKKTFPIREAIAPMVERQSGLVEVSTPDGDKVVVYYRMGSIGWTYALVVPTDTVL